MRLLILVLAIGCTDYTTGAKPCQHNDTLHIRLDSLPDSIIVTRCGAYLK